MVTFIFWTLYFIDIDLIIPKKIEELIPNWQNHIMHTLPLIVIFVEMLIKEHYYEKSIIKAITPLVLFTLAYLIW